MTESIDGIIAGLWENGHDSITHALYHFSEREQERSNRRHHDKWIVLSVHHAAECICNMRLLGLEPRCPLFSQKKSEMWFPSLSKTIERLQLPINSGRQSSAEHQLFLLLSKLPDIRNKFMHKTAPKELDISIAAMCMIGILKYIERLKGVAASDIIWQSPPIEGDVVAAIRYTRLVEYSNFVTLFLREKYPNLWLPQCPSCGVRAVVSSICEACFSEIDSIACSGCDEPIYFMAWQRDHGDRLVKCQECGLEQTL
jgi:DNA-directed RNA polymerase subunit RPC12/RpoP